MFKKIRMQLAFRLAALFGLMVLSSVSSFAANAGNALPWEGPLTTLVTSLTGPVAYAISVVAIVALGAGLAFGGEMSETMRRMLQVGLAVCMVVFAAQVMSSWIGQGAEVAYARPPLHSPASSLGNVVPASPAATASAVG